MSQVKFLGSAEVGPFRPNLTSSNGVARSRGHSLAESHRRSRRAAGFDGREHGARLGQVGATMPLPASAAFCARASAPCSDSATSLATPRASQPPAPVPAADAGGVRKDPRHMRAPFDLLVQPLQHVGRFHVLVVRQWQPVIGQRLLDILLHPTAQPAILAAPLCQPADKSRRTSASSRRS
jgi:hypothetical protein